MIAADRHPIEFSCRFSQEDFNRFAELSGDDNPIHTDPEFAAQTRFQTTVAHGMLLYGVVCRAVGALFPHRPVLTLRQELIFENPTPAGAENRIRAWVEDEAARRHTAEVGAVVELPDGRNACRSRAVVRWADPYEGYAGIETHDEAHPQSEARTYRHLTLGQKASIRKRFTLNDRHEYTLLTGDDNPLFLDPQSARRAGFQDCPIPGPLLSALFSRLLGTRLPGRGTNWLKQQLEFLSPAFWNDELTATVELVRLRPEKHLANLNGECRDGKGNTVCRARSLVWVKDIEG